MLVKIKILTIIIDFINIKDLNILVEEPALDGEGAAAVRPLASSSPAPVRILVSGTEFFCKSINFMIFILVSAEDLSSSGPPDGGQRRDGEKSKIL